MILRASGDGWILQNGPNDQGLWFDTEDSARQWAEGMGVTVETPEPVDRGPIDDDEQDIGRYLSQRGKQ